MPPTMFDFSKETTTCYKEDRGDAVLLIAPPAIAADRFLEPVA